MDTVKQIAEHPIFPLFESLESSFSELKETIPEAETLRFDRLFALFALLRDNVSGSERNQIPTQSLQNAHQQLSSCKSQINSFNSSRDLGHLSNAQNHLSSALAAFPTKFRSGRKNVYRSVLDEVGDVSQKIIKELRSEIDTNKNTLNELKAETDTLRARITEEQARISAGLGNVETQFTNSQATRSEAFQKLLDEMRISREKVIDAFNDELSEFLKKNRERIESETARRTEKFDEIESDAALKHQAILELYNLVGENSLIGGYVQRAKISERSAVFWDVVAYAFMTLGIIMLVGPSLASYFQSGFTNVDWLQVLARVPTSTVLFAPAAYAIAQARRLKRTAETSRERQLQLAALGPYLSTLPSEVQEKIRAILTPRFFSSNPDEKFALSEIYELIREDNEE
ncbi:hypothetical protein [Ponticaulis sp.]|uniref:hypothetical protein n=1 Tax=Ponticaulis sp. TaxID=2020902 RepID=UPI002630D35A|nr:hypothetical protein [Ponticaulis sp.]MDF1679803.1 hypothetical protein [Ponticaulis sp.]